MLLFALVKNKSKVGRIRNNMTGVGEYGSKIGAKSRCMRFVREKTVGKVLSEWEISKSYP